MSNDHNHANAVDVHAHWYPREWLDLVRDHGPAHGIEWTEVPGKGPQFKVGHLATGPAGPQFVDLDARLAAMDAQGVAVHALSLSQPMVYWAGRDLGARLAAVFNDALVRAHERAPARLVGLAALPMQAPDLAVQEVDQGTRRTSGVDQPAELCQNQRVRRRLVGIGALPIVPEADADRVLRSRSGSGHRRQRSRPVD